MKTLLVDRSPEGIVTVALHRPEKKNAIDATMWDELMAVFREVAESTSDRVLVLTGAGGAFCAGADLTPTAGNKRHQLDLMHHFGWVGLALHEIPKPTIAKVNGVAVSARLSPAPAATPLISIAEIFVPLVLNVIVQILVIVALAYLVLFPMLADRLGQRAAVLGSFFGFGLAQSATALSGGCILHRST